ncbi:MAG TPA: hypothetical protein VG298_13490 [Acidimicrobiales bacterium]|jgi:hypothetical protein|nr:hypothetical protein [Acidimicrobiales bacterium]
MLGLVDGANWAEIFTGIGTVVVATSVIFAGIQLRDGRKARTAEIVRELAQRWESTEMVLCRKLISTHGTGDQSTDSLKNAVETALQSGSDDYYRYTQYLNFFEQIGLSFTDDAVGFKVVSKMFKGTIEANWKSWRIVIPHVWGTGSGVGENFRLLAAKIERRRLRHQAWAPIRRFLSEPY